MQTNAAFQQPDDDNDGATLAATRKPLVAGDNVIPVYDGEGRVIGEALLHLEWIDPYDDDAVGVTLPVIE